MALLLYIKTVVLCIYMIYNNNTVSVTSVSQDHKYFDLNLNLLKLDISLYII